MNIPQDIPGEGGVAIVASRSFIESPGVAPRGRLVLPAPGDDPVGVVADAVGEAHGRGREGTEGQNWTISGMFGDIFLWPSTYLVS